MINLFAHPKTDAAKQLVQSYLHQLLPHDLFHSIQKTQTANTYPLLQLSFMGETAAKPIISHLSQKFQLEINILQANIEYIQNENMGIMLTQIKSDKKITPRVYDYLSQAGVEYEVLGYVASTV